MSMIPAIKQFKKEHKREPNHSELARLLKCSRITVNKRLALLLKEGKIQPVKPIRIMTADYELV
jgi:hypothetical protein